MITGGEQRQGRRGDRSHAGSEDQRCLSTSYWNGALRALNRAGIRVPDQCSVIGFDNVATSALYRPSLTMVRQPMETMGASAVGVVLDGINAVLEKREAAPRRRTVAPELVLVVRESTRRLA